MCGALLSFNLSINTSLINYHSNEGETVDTNSAQQPSTHTTYSIMYNMDTGCH